MSKAADKIRRGIGEAAVKYRMFAQNDRVLAAVSGGKDSMVMLDALAALRARSPIKFELACAVFDPGFPEFPVDAVQKFAEARGIECHIVSYDVPALLKEKSADERPCVLCSRLRRGYLYDLAERLNCNKLALGQHLDDIATSLLIGLFRGQGLTTMGPNIPADERPIRVIRPLALLTEECIAAAAAELGVDFHERCPYAAELATSGDRARFKRVIAELAAEIPHLRENMLRSMSDLRPGYLLDDRFIDFD